MTQDAVENASSFQEQHLLRGWRSVIFAPVGSGQRRRRGSDGVRLAAAVLILVCCLLVIRYDSRIDRAITQVIHPPPWSITWLVTVVYEAGSIGVAVALVGLALLARRWEVARDIGLSAAGTAAVCGILIALLGSRGGRAVPGARRAAPHRDLHRPGGPGVCRRRPRAAAQRPGEPRHRLGGDG